jgi:cAMP-dependent protein kinase regulator
MGSAASIDLGDDAQLKIDEVRNLVGDAFDENKFRAAAGENDFITGAQLKKVLASAASKAEDKGDESDEDDDYEPDDPNAPVYVPPAVISKKGRKTGVSAESMDPAKMKEQMKNITCIVKEPEVHERLLAVVAKSALLRALDEEQKDAIVKAFSGPVIKPPGENVIVQGELGDVFFLLEEGLVDVYISKGGSPEIKVHTYKPGDAFGELAIMYNAPRAATCRAQTESKLWALDRVSFKCIVVAAAMQKREMYKGFLANVPILSSLNEMEVMTLADSLAEEKYADGDFICKQGDEGNFFYIIKEGEAVCSIDKDGVDKEVARLTSGQVFGEIALLTAKPRQATVRAAGELKVLAIDRATFTRVMGPLDTIMQRNIEEYEKLNATLNTEGAV